MSQTVARPVRSVTSGHVADPRLAWVTAFAVGVLIDALHFAEPLLSLYSVATFAAVGVVLDPRSRGRLMLLAASLSAASLWYLPDIWNHWVLVGVLGTTIAVWMSWRWIRDRGAAPSNGELVERAAPFLRVGFLLTFGFAAFAKLNSDFLDAATSCALWIVERVPGAPVVPDPGRPLVVATALGIELLIPVLLIVRRTRMLAIAVAWGFHLATAVGGHAAFAGFAWSFYLLFLPRPVLERATAIAHDGLVRTARWTRSGLGLTRSGAFAWSALGGVVLLTIAATALFPFGPSGRAPRVAAALVYTVWSAATGWAVFRAWLQTRDTRAAETDGPRRPGFWSVGAWPAVALSVIVVSAVAPYLGFKTQYSFTMYSDLRTEAGRWNHLLVPEAVKVGSWQDDVVTVTSTTDGDLASLLRLTRDGPGTSIPMLEARRLSHEFPEATVEYAYGEETTIATRFADDPVIGEDLPWAMRKVARFRPVETPAGDTCQH